MPVERDDDWTDWVAVIEIDSGEFVYRGVRLDIAADRLEPGTTYGTSAISRRAAEVTARRSAQRFRKLRRFSREVVRV